MGQTVARLLVVGGNGFIGRHIVKRAVMLGWDITSLSLSPQKIFEEPSAVVRRVSVDITDMIMLKKALGDAKFDYVVNCSGYIDHKLFFNEGRGIIDCHFLGVLNLVELLNRDVLQSFINIGSSDEYGNTLAPQIESQREEPVSPYSLGKVAATHFLQMLNRTENFPATTLRLFLTYGPGQESRRFLPQIIQGCLDGRSFPTSHGEQLRDFCYVEDTVDALFSVFSRSSTRGEVINIASGNPIAIRQMIELIRKLIGRGEPRFGEIAYRIGENMALYADISKAKALLNWSPRVNIENGLDKTIQAIRGSS